MVAWIVKELLDWNWRDSGNYRVQIHPKTRTWQDSNIQVNHDIAKVKNLDVQAKVVLAKS